MSIHNLITQDVLAEICPQFKQLRIERGISIEELHNAVNISVHSLKRMEQGKRLPYSYFKQLANFYGVRVRIVLELKRE